MVRVVSWPLFLLLFAQCNSCPFLQASEHLSHQMCPLVTGKERRMEEEKVQVASVMQWINE